jgi:hypothetical protein
MTPRTLLLYLLGFLLFSSCKGLYDDDFEASIPPEKIVRISFPGLAVFEIIQNVKPDSQGIKGEVTNSYLISNALNRPLEQLKFGIYIFDSEKRFESNLLAAYIDSLQQPLPAFANTEKIEFDKRVDDPIQENSFDIFILSQDVEDTHPFSGIYRGEAFLYTTGDSTANLVPYVAAVIDCKGDVVFRASGRNVVDFTIDGRVSTAGQFFGTATPQTGELPEGDFENKMDTKVSLQNERLNMTLTPSDSSNVTLDSIVLMVNRN